MRIDELHANRQAQNRQTLRDLAKYAHTLEFARKMEEAQRVLYQFLERCHTPVVSCGGGKDGTAVLLLAANMDPDIRVVCANPPNPLPDREDHLHNLKHFMRCTWDDVSYPWDVDAVLDGEKPYPNKLKVRRLSQWAAENGVDGVIFGLRNAESKARALNFAQNGHIYTTRAGLRCQPLARWTWRDVICLSLLWDAPINPVYTKMDGISNLDHLHDGTWWPHGTQDRAAWMRRYYPDFYPLYLAAQKVEGQKEYIPCTY